jgi:hypothetical protein
MNHINCHCAINCACGCKLRNNLSVLLDVISSIDHKRSSLSEILDCEVIGFDGITDKIMFVIGEMLEIDSKSNLVDNLYEIVFDYVFKRKEKFETIERLLEL